MGSFLRFLMLKYVNDGDAATALGIALTKIITRLMGMVSLKLKMVGPS